MQRNENYHFLNPNAVDPPTLLSNEVEKQRQDFLLSLKGSMVENIHSIAIHFKPLGVTPVIVSGKVNEQSPSFLILDSWSEMENIPLIAVHSFT